jgi:3-oxoacyl-[acyl-carrier protein] reductase
MWSLEGRVALVTGAAQGIGAATARRLSASGAAVAVLDMNAEAAQATAAEIEAEGGRAISLVADVADTEQAGEAVAATVKALGGLDILVNNAGITRDNLLFKMTDDDWDSVVRVHLRGSFCMARAAQRQMVTDGWGRIINLSSTSALGNRGQANYAAAKAGLQGFTKTLAIELGPFGITVNSIAPGFIETAMTTATAVRVGSSIEERKASVAATLPVRRSGVPDDIAAGVCYLASESAGYVTGQVIYIDGGRGLL